jgi:hypothetical protein
MTFPYLTDTNESLLGETIPMLQVGGFRSTKGYHLSQSPLHRLKPVPVRLFSTSTDPAILVMFIPFVSHFPARASRERLVGPNDTTFISHLGDSSFTHPLERRKGGGGGGKGKGPSSSSSALSDSLLIITAHPLSTRM